MTQIASTVSLAAALCASNSGCASTSSADARSATAPRPGVIVALGDSLTSGHGIGRQDAYPAVIQRYLDGRKLPFSVVNAGVSGNTTADAVARLDRALHGKVDILVIALGANDGLRGVPVARVKAQLAAIIEEAQRRGISPILCAQEALPIHGWNYSVKFRRLYRELAATYDVPLVPFILANVFGRIDLLQPDLVHPNAAGARMIAGVIWPYVLAEAERRAELRQAS